MVALKEKALSCEECHNTEGRLKEVKGFYMPGRDRNLWVDRIGILLVAAALLGVLGHGLLRIVLRARRKQS